MKYFVFIFLFTQTFLIYSQKIVNGKYESVIRYDSIAHKFYLDGDFTERIHIKNDSVFKYYYNDDVTNKIGAGLYKLIKNKLILIFGNITDYVDTASYKIIKEEDESSDSIDYKIISCTEEGEPLQCTIISVSDTDNTDKRNYQTDKDGICNIKIPKIKIPFLLQSHYIGYRPIKLIVRDTTSKTLEVYMKDYKIMPAGNSIVYSIKGIKENEFYLRGNMWYKWTLFVTGVW